MTKIYTEYEELKQEIISCLEWKACKYNPEQYYENFVLCGSNILNPDRLKFITQESPDDEYTGQCYTIIELDGILYRLNYTYRSHYGYEMDYIHINSDVKKKQMVVDYYD